MNDTIIFPSFKKIVNKPFQEIYNNKDRLILLWGGRDSGKSVATRRKLIIRCLKEKYFRYILVRKVFASIKDSQYQGIKDDVYKMGLQDYFHFTVNPLEITCVNGNKFVCRGLDKPETIKSLTDPTGAWYEEGNQMTEEDFITVSTSLRSTQADYIQEIFSFNPECDENFEDFWIYRWFFKGKSEDNFRDEIVIKLPENKEVIQSYTSIHSTYIDNPFCPLDRQAKLEQLKETNPYYYTIYTLGKWGNREVGGRFWKCFDRVKHVGKIEIIPNYQIEISFDENVNPYPALTIWQMKDKEIRQVHEICLRTPNNKLANVARELCAWYRQNGWNDLTVIHGDATSDKEDTKLEKGVNYFTMLQKEIESQGFRTRIKKNSTNPSIQMSAEFINAIYEGYQGYSIVINEDCKNSINDYVIVQEDTHGKMKKPKDQNGWEIAGHCSDTKRYVLIDLLYDVYRNYQRGPEKLEYSIGRNEPRQVY